MSLKLWSKMLLANQSLVLFSCQNFMKVLISDFDFFNVDRHEWKKQDCQWFCWKNSCSWQMGHLGTKHFIALDLLKKVFPQWKGPRGVLVFFYLFTEQFCLVKLLLWKKVSRFQEQVCKSKSLHKLCFL